MRGSARSTACVNQSPHRRRSGRKNRIHQ
jgi:hypothetical protein